MALVLSVLSADAGFAAEVRAIYRCSGSLIVSADRTDPTKAVFERDLNQHIEIQLIENDTQYAAYQAFLGTKIFNNGSLVFSASTGDDSALGLQRTQPYYRENHSGWIETHGPAIVYEANLTDRKAEVSAMISVGVPDAAVVRDSASTYVEVKVYRINEPTASYLTACTKTEF